MEDEENKVVTTPILDDDEIDPGMQVNTPNYEPVAYIYDPNDPRVVHITNQVIEFCGYEMTEVPQNPDEEPGVPVPLDDTEVEPIDPDDPDKKGQIDPDKPGEPYPEQTDELDKLREEYKIAKDQNLKEREELWPKIWQAIRYISHLACWTDTDNDTFLTSIRHQAVEVSAKCACTPECCECDANVITIKLDYWPVPHNPFSIAHLSGVYGGEILREVIDHEYLNDHYDPVTNTLYINRHDFPNLLFDKGRACCLCDHHITIDLEYLAGYDDIPDGILPIICPIISKINESKVSMSSCHQAMTQVAGLLKRKKSGNVEYEWSNVDSDSQKTQTLYTELYNIATLDEVMAISRCYILETPEEMGDVI